MSSCWTPWTASPLGSPVHGILQARILEWVAISFSWGSFQPRNRAWVYRVAGRFFTSWAVLCSVAWLCLTLGDPMGCSLSGSSVHGDSPGKHTGVDYHAFLQRIFPTKGLNPGLPHWRWILYHLSHQGSPPTELQGIYWRETVKGSYLF